MCCILTDCSPLGKIICGGGNWDERLGIRIISRILVLCSIGCRRLWLLGYDWSTSDLSNLLELLELVCYQFLVADWQVCDGEVHGQRMQLVTNPICQNNCHHFPGNPGLHIFSNILTFFYIIKQCLIFNHTTITYINNP